MHRVLVVGGAGHFGRIIARRIRESGVHVIITARDAARAERTARQIGCEAARLDIGGEDLQAAIERISPDVIISAAGPFQPWNYRLPKAAIASSSHYIDLADNRAYVCGFDALDAAARSRDVLLVSGASSVPALAAAVIDHYAPAFRALEQVDYGISSSERMLGLATVRGVLAHCGKPFTRLEDGAWSTIYGWDDVSTRRLNSLGARWFASCDVPDLELLPRRYPSLRTVRFRAGTGLRITHYGLWLIARLVRLGLISDASRYARILRAAAVALEPLGDGQSAMFIQLDGTGNQGAPQRRIWELVARRNHGIEIPCIAAVVLARKLASGTVSRRGACACVGLVSLQEYLAELDGLDVSVSEN